MSELLRLQIEFTRMVGLLIEYAYMNGYQLTFGETYRPKETAALYAKKGIGSKNSLHCDRLAVDLNLFKAGNLDGSVKGYQLLGEFWENMSKKDVKTCWGGRIKKLVDLNHFSVSFQGRK